MGTAPLALLPFTAARGTRTWLMENVVPRDFTAADKKQSNRHHKLRLCYHIVLISHPGKGFFLFFYFCYGTAARGVQLFQGE